MLLLFLLALANAGVVTEFSLKRDAHADDLVTFSLALKQRNLVQFKNHVAELSNPMSHKYGKWMSIAEINAMIAPTLAQKKPLLAMLKARGIRVVEDRGDNLVVRAKASDVSLFDFGCFC
jgi:subtilase family serine protease